MSELKSHAKPEPYTIKSKSHTRKENYVALSFDSKCESKKGANHKTDDFSRKKIYIHPI
jgi:hypothetical protein